VELFPAARGAGRESPGVLRGHAAVFGILSANLGDFRERIAPGAFARTIQRDDIRALVNHDASLLLARNRNRTLRLHEDARGLAVEIQLPNTTVGRDLAELVRLGTMSQMSFGFRVPEGGESWTREGGQPVRVLSEIQLFDTAVVTFAAYPETDVSLSAPVDRAAVADDGDLDRRRRRLRLAELNP
jgi:HK97 family phage prohead protease